MEKTSKICQSCGMPMKKDPEMGGAEKDGSKSKIYCSYCYDDGTFRFEGNVKDFQEFCRVKMIESGNPKLMSWLFTRGMSRLSRWKN